MDPWTFIYAGDMQPGSPKSYRYNPSWIKNWEQAKSQIIEINPDFLLVGGDLTRDGSIHRYELEEMKADLGSLPFPVHAVAGNMDTGNKHAAKDGRGMGEDQCKDPDLNVTSAQLEQFVSVVGPLWWSFVHKGIRFSGVSDMFISSGLLEEHDFWYWAEGQRRNRIQEHHVWITHYPLFIEKPDEPDWDMEDHYKEWYFSIDRLGRERLIDLFKATGTDLVISGHIHCHKIYDIEGIRYEIAPATSFGQWGERWADGDASLGFLKYDVTEAGIKSEFVPLEKTFDLEGYGPEGHPVLMQEIIQRHGKKNKTGFDIL